MKLGRRLGLPFPTFLGALGSGIRFKEKKKKKKERKKKNARASFANITMLFPPGTTRR